MKKIIYGAIVLVALGVFAYSCDELLGDLINFDGDYYVMDFTIQPTSQTGLQVFNSETFDSELDTILSNHNLTRDQLTSVTLKEALLDITSEDKDFDFVDYLEITLESPGLDSKTIAWEDTIPDNQSEVTLTLTEDDLQNYLSAEEFTLAAKGFINTAIAEAVPVQAKVKFRFKGGL
jgi:hypothetical protein